MSEEKGPTVVAFLLMRWEVGKEWDICDKLVQKEFVKLAFPVKKMDYTPLSCSI